MKPCRQPSGITDPASAGTFLRNGIRISAYDEEYWHDLEYPRQPLRPRLHLQHITGRQRAIVVVSGRDQPMPGDDEQDRCSAKKIDVSITFDRRNRGRFFGL